MRGLLTGLIQHRTLRVSRTITVLVLQVEERLPPHPDAPTELRWRDARSEDLAHLPDLYHMNKERPR